VNDPQGEPGYGRTNWRRFAVAVGVPAVVAAGLLIATANGALAASFSVSGTQFKLKADVLDGHGFTQYSDQLKKGDGTKIPAVMSGIKSADITRLCQSVAAGPVVLRIEAGPDDQHKVHADDLLIGMSSLAGDATFQDMNIGQDASTLNADGADHSQNAGFGQQAKSVYINNLQQKAYSTQASTFVLKGMTLQLFIGDSSKECFAG